MQEKTAPTRVARRTTQRRRRSNCLAAGLLLAGLAVCLAGVAAFLGLQVLPAQAEQRFGPPAESHDRFTRVYLAAQLLLAEQDLTQPLRPADTTPRAFQVQLGESTRSITARLQEEGFISDAAALRTYLVYAGLDTTLQAGDYRLTPALTPLQIAQELQDATPDQVTFRVLPGWRLEEIAAGLPTSGLTFSPEAFLAAATGRPAGFEFLAALPPQATLEGFLLPGTYEFARDTDAEGFVAALVAQFDEQVTEELRQAFAAQGLDLFEAVTLASIVEREAVVDEEMALIASVFYNRLAAGMKLDSDPTVQYAVGYNEAQGTWWTNPLSLADLRVNSVYNTYLVGGLPPGPIANPGLDALTAVAYPEESPYYFFRATCDESGRHAFAESYEEHLQNACP